MMKSVLLLIVGFLFFPSSMLEAAGGGRARTNIEVPTATPSSDVINQPLSLSVLKTTQRTLFQRILQVRLFHSGTWTLFDSSQTPVTVGRTLASLHPSFVTGLVRVSDHGEISHSEEDGFNVIRTAVRSSSKACRFDVLLNAGNERSGDLMVRQMKEISTRLHPDAWTFYVSPHDPSVNPDVLQEGIAAAHAEGQLVGYDGPLSLVPEGIDYLVVRAWDLKVNRKQIDLFKSSKHVPLIVELPTTFDNQPSPGTISYVQKLSTAERADVLEDLAENQTLWGYRFAYPVFYPLYPAKHAFDATKDPILMVTIRSLLTRFN